MEHNTIGQVFNTYIEIFINSKSYIIETTVEDSKTVTFKGFSFVLPSGSVIALRTTIPNIGNIFTLFDSNPDTATIN